MTHSIEDANEDLMNLISRCYKLSLEKDDLANEFYIFSRDNTVEWEAGWPSNLLIGFFNRINTEVKDTK